MQNEKIYISNDKAKLQIAKDYLKLWKNNRDGLWIWKLVDHSSRRTVVSGEVTFHILRDNIYASFPASLRGDDATPMKHYRICKEILLSTHGDCRTLQDDYLENCQSVCFFAEASINSVVAQSVTKKGNKAERLA